MTYTRPPADLIASIAEELPLAVWLARADGELLYVNRAFYEVLGFPPPDDATRGNYAKTYGVHRRSGEPYPESEMPFERALRERRVVVIEDLVIHHDDGRRIPLRVWAKPLVDARGEITHVLEQFTDISRELAAERDREAAEERARRAQRMEAVGNLAGGIAHDFNNLLATVKLLASGLAAEESDPKKLEVLGHIQSVGDSAVQLTRGLLGFAGRSRSAVQRVPLNTVVAELGAIARRTVERRITLEWVLHAASGDVVADRSQVEQVLMNLVLNARDAIPGTGSIVVRTSDVVVGEGAPGLAPGRYVALEVEDTGAGIDPSVRERVFEPYVTTKQFGAVKGTGLGLATAYGIVRSHGGALEVRQTGPGGTVMRALFPAAEPAARAQPALAAVTRELHAGAGTVLVVDDEPLVRRAMAEGLALAGYRTLEAADGVDALAVFRRHRGHVACVVLDMTMPSLSGREAFAALRELEPHVPVLLVSGFAVDDDAAALLDEGASGLLPKPFDVATLTSAVAKAVRDGADPGSARPGRVPRA